MGYKLPFILLAVISVVSAAQSERPNVLLILTDDLGYQDLRVLGLRSTAHRAGSQ